MSKQGDDWTQCLLAADRKIDIAKYHFEQLCPLVALEQMQLLVTPATEADPEPSIAVQAHLEGVLAAFVAATDQIAEAVVHAYRLPLEQANVDLALQRMPKYPVRRRMFRWLQTPIAADVRDIRRLAIHHHYTKAVMAKRFEVQLTGARPYPGSRALDEYSNAAVQHLEILRPCLSELYPILSDAAAGNSQEPSQR